MSFLNKLKKSILDTSTSIDYFADKDLTNTRMNICIDCDKLIKVTKQCNECFCFVQAKTKIKNQQCPLGKW